MIIPNGNWVLGKGEGAERTEKGAKRRTRRTVELRVGRDVVGVGGDDHLAGLEGDGHERVEDLLEVDVRHIVCASWRFDYHCCILWAAGNIVLQVLILSRCF